MIRYIVLIIIIIMLISLFSLFEKPPVNQYVQKQNREVAIEKVDKRKNANKTPRMKYDQSAMDFLIDAYGVGLP